MAKLRDDALSPRAGKGRSYLKNTLVVVDEVGYMPVCRQDAHLFFRFVCCRYEKSSTIITSNKSFSEWEELFGDPVIATAILDRLLHRCQVVNIRGNSYRLKEYQQRAAVPKRPETAMCEVSGRREIVALLAVCAGVFTLAAANGGDLHYRGFFAPGGTLFVPKTGTLPHAD